MTSREGWLKRRTKQAKDAHAFKTQGGLTSFGALNRKMDSFQTACPIESLTIKIDSVF